MKNLNEYKIEFKIERYIWLRLEEGFAEALENNDTELLEDCVNDYHFLKQCEKGYVVSTLQEYFNLLARISLSWETDFHIYNNGRFIVIGED